MNTLLNEQSPDRLFDSRTEAVVLSCLMRNTLILGDHEHILSVDDFYKVENKVIFCALKNKFETDSISSCTPMDLINWTSENKEGINYESAVTVVANMAEVNPTNNFEPYYKTLKRFSLLRDLNRNGFSVAQFQQNTIDPLDVDPESRLGDTTPEEILNSYKEAIATIENKYAGKDNGKAQNAFQGLEELVEEYKRTPEIGFPIDGKYLNYAARGARSGKMYIYSSNSGGGKTRYMVGLACSIAFPKITDLDSKKIINRPVSGYRKVLFMTTEQQADEIQTMILANVSGVNEKNILLGTYTKPEEERIKKALFIINTFKDNFIIDAMPDPSLAMVKARLTKWILKAGVEYIFYDYIFTSPGLVSEFSQSKIREDVALMMLSNTLKEIAMTYDVYVQSATQLNEGWSQKTVGLRDQNCIRGSKAIADKADFGAIGIRLGEDERAKIAPLVQTLKAKGAINRDPNVVIDIYKNRRGELNSVKIFRYFDYGTCRCEDLFITDSEYGLLTDQIPTTFNADEEVEDYSKWAKEVAEKKGA